MTSSPGEAAIAWGPSPSENRIAPHSHVALKRTQLAGFVVGVVYIFAPAVRAISRKRQGTAPLLSLESVSNKWRNKRQINVSALMIYEEQVTVFSGKAPL